MKFDPIGGRKMVAFLFTQTVFTFGLFFLQSPDIKEKIISTMVLVFCGFIGANFGGKIIEKIKGKLP